VSGAVGLGAVVLAVALWPSGSPPTRTTTGPIASQAPVAVATAAPFVAVAPAPLRGSVDRTLALPAAVTWAELSAIPDRYLNDPPAARLRLPVLVRGMPGIASAESPAEVAWSEGGHWYWLRAKDLTLGQLIDLATALR
jgi:hypothetical protein